MDRYHDGLFLDGGLYLRLRSAPKGNVAQLLAFADNGVDTQ
ncbi:MAG: hypothetical protein SO100_07610 [Dysosmobacter sp.]|nr:hypothetical protein [Dysosmobacter sp.]